jgi:lactate permease
MIILLAALPLIAILVLMLVFRWSGAQAGAVGWLVALVVAALAFSAGPQALVWAQIRGIFRAVYVLYIIWGALLFFRVTEADGTLEAMSASLRQLSPGKTLQVLLLAWGFASFLQGVGGFGVPVAVVAPILVSMGFSPLEAVVMPSLGHAWAISFGSLGASYEALISATGISGSTIAPWMAIALGLVCFVVGFLLLVIAAGRDESKRRAQIYRELGPMLTMATGMTVIQYIAASNALPNIAAMLGSLTGLIIGSIWALVRRRDVGESASRSLRETLTRMIPYLLLIVIILTVNLIAPLQQALNQVVLQVNVPALTLNDGRQIPAGKTKGISIFGHPGAQLILTGILTLIFAKAQGYLPPGSGKQIRKGVLRSGVKSTLGILAMMTMATTMQMVGMVELLSQAMADLAGQFFPLISPFIGALGAFMTGSNTNSNVLLGAFQQNVAQALGLTVPLILAIHNAGAAVGSVFAPAKIIVGCSTVGLSGGEGAALRRTSRYGLLIITLLAVVGIIVSQFSL